MRYPIQYSIVCLSLASILSGCSTVSERRTASGNFDYLEVTAQAPVAVPESLSAPTAYRDFVIPPAASQNGLVGKDLPVVSPALVLTTAQGTYLEEAQISTSAVFDKLDNEADIRTLVMQRLATYFERESIGFTIPDQQGNVVLTDWILTSESGESPWYSLSDDSQEVGKRFQLTIEPASHERSARLSVELTDLVVAQGADLVDTLEPFAKRELEAELLNGIIRQYSLEQKIASQQRLAQIRSGIPSELGFDAAGNGALVLGAQYDIAWPKLQLVLRKLGFNVKDLDKSNGLIFVNYQGQEDGWFGSWFGSGDKLALAQDDYRLQVTRLSANKTAITFMDEQNEPFTAAKVAELFPVFADTFQRDNLDI
jgi:outer membrane protein assembly factor BamC